MIELLVTCYLLVNQEWIPPKGWTVTKVFTGGWDFVLSVTPTACGPNGCPTPKPYVILTRRMNNGDRLSLPDGCQVEATLK